MSKTRQCHQCGRDVKVKGDHSLSSKTPGYVCGLYPNCSKTAKKYERVFSKPEDVKI